MDRITVDNAPISANIPVKYRPIGPRSIYYSPYNSQVDVNYCNLRYGHGHLIIIHAINSSKQNQKAATPNT